MPHTSEKLNLTPDYCRHEVHKVNMKRGRNHFNLQTLTKKIRVASGLK